MGPGPSTWKFVRAGREQYASSPVNLIIYNREPAIWDFSRKLRSLPRTYLCTNLRPIARSAGHFLFSHAWAREFTMFLLCYARTVRLRILRVYVNWFLSTMGGPSELTKRSAVSSRKRGECLFRPQDYKRKQQITRPRKFELASLAPLAIKTFEHFYSDKDLSATISAGIHRTKVEFYIR